MLASSSEAHQIWYEQPPGQTLALYCGEYDKNMLEVTPGGMTGSSNTAVKGLNASLFSADYADTWRQHYLGAVHTQPLAEGQDLIFDLNLYRTQDTGKALSGRIDNTSWSLLSTYKLGAHSFGLGYQKVDGDTPFDYVTRGAIYLSNAGLRAGR